MIRTDEELRREARAEAAPAAGRGTGNVDDMLRRLDRLLVADPRDPRPANGNVPEPIIAAARKELQARGERQQVFGPALALDPPGTSSSTSSSPARKGGR